MSDPSQPKGNPPAESPTKAFVLKMDDWMTDLLKADLQADAEPPAEQPVAEQPAGATPGNGTERGG